MEIQGIRQALGQLERETKSGAMRSRKIMDEVNTDVLKKINRL